ncbi:MAG: TolC family outer membrane protein [Rhodobacterales bacterium]|nr:TolC family outer membrane protein [Rhodobacterales bacterium]
MITLMETARRRPVRSRRAGLRRALLAGVMALSLPTSVLSDTLADALAGAYNTSGLLEQNRALLRAADEDVASTMSLLRPIINWSTDITRDYNKRTGGRTSILPSSDTTSLNAGLVAQWLVFDFGRSRLSTEAAKEAVLATRQSLVGVEQEVLLRAVRAYMNVQRSIRFVSLRESNVRVISESLRAAQDRFDVGEVTRTDVAQAEARLSLSRSNQAQAVGDLKRANEEYLAVVGKPPENISQPRDLPILTSSEDTAKQVALRNHPDLLRAQHDVATANLNVLVADAAMKPRVTLNARVGVSQQLDGNSYGETSNVGVDVGGPIYQGGALTSTKRRAYALRDAQLGVLHQTQDRVRQNVGVAYAVLEAARAVAASSVEAVSAGRVAFEGVNEEASLGARTTLDVLNAEQEYLDAQAEQIAAQAEVIIAAYAVLASMGQLTVRDLNLAVQTYDPTVYYNLVKDAPAAVSPRGRALDRVLRKIGQ